MVISQYTLMHRLTYEQISVLLPLWEVKYCLWWTHTCFIFHPSVPLEFLECFGPPACSQNTDGIHCHAQTGSYRNEWWIGHSSSSSSAETFAQDASLRLYCFLIVGSVVGDILHHILLFFQHLALFSRYCVKLKIEHLSHRRSNQKKVGMGNLMIFPIPDNITHMHEFFFRVLYLPQNICESFPAGSFDLECMWICSFYSCLHIIISSNPFNRCLVLTEIFISTSEDQMDPNISLFFCLRSCSPL